MNNCQKCNNNPVSNLKGTENWKWKNEKECCKKEEAPKWSTCQREPIYMQGLKECLNCLRMAPELKAQIIQRPPYNY